MGGNFLTLLLAITRLSLGKMFAIFLFITLFVGLYEYQDEFVTLAEHYHNISHANPTVTTITKQTAEKIAEKITKHLEKFPKNSIRFIRTYQFVPPGDEIGYIGRSLVSFHSIKHSEVIVSTNSHHDFVPIRSFPSLVNNILNDEAAVINLLVDDKTFKSLEEDTISNLSYLRNVEGIECIIASPITIRGKVAGYIMVDVINTPEHIDEIKKSLIIITADINSYFDTTKKIHSSIVLSSP